MSGASSSAAAWSGRLTPARPTDGLRPQAGDSPLGLSAQGWAGESAAFRPGRPVLVGFPQDEGVRRNGGRVGSALAPEKIRRFLYRLTDSDVRGGDLAGLDLLDLGDLLVDADLEASQALLGDLVGELLRSRCVPIILGGGHETALGTYLGYVASGREVAVVNVDAHLDVRPLGADGRGTSGTPFLQMMSHPTRPLPGDRYVCLGAQPANVAREHREFVRSRGGEIVWAADVKGRLIDAFARTRERLAAAGCLVHVSLDADVVRASDVPGVSAPAPLGLDGAEVVEWARAAGASPEVSSFEVVEINPLFDLDDRSVRWAALVVWHFLAGLAGRSGL